MNKSNNNLNSFCKMKKFFYLATALVALASCTNDDVVGDGKEFPVNGELRSISFQSSTAATTRADYTGATAATKLGNNFVVEGIKWDGGTSTKEVVFDHYNVNYVDGTANTTTSNTAGWEYVAQTKNDLAGIAAQSIKYWDYAKSQYDFIAFSAGTATAVYSGTPGDGEVLYTAITPATMTSATGGAYTVKGKAADLAKVYIADLKTAYRDPVATGDYNKEVEFKFRSLSAKVRVALYETVPGYYVKDVKFYTDATTPATDSKAHLFTTGTDVFNEAGTYTVYYPTIGSTNTGKTDYNKAHVSFAADATSGTTADKAFGALDLTNTGADKEVAEAAGKVYLGRSSNAATYAGENTTANPNYYTVVIPNETGAVLNLKVNYKLVSTDGSGEVINVTGSTAQVPAEFASWKSGYAYTYIFKISQNTNGQTNPALGPAGLYPITFDAVVTETEDGVQETITTVATPSITTYAKGAIVTANDEYTAGSNIYAIVENGTALTVGTNANLYTVTIEAGAAQTINEASVANALANGAAGYDEGTVLAADTELDGYFTKSGDTYTACTAGTKADGTTTYYRPKKVVTDANGKKMTVTNAAGLDAVTEIAATDAPDGNAITVNGAKFTPAAAGIYAFEYINGTDKYYKIIKVQ